jgi:hypothetical protein
VIWSDEKKFNLDGPDGMQYYWVDLRKELEIFSKNVHGGGSVIVWAAFSWDGTTDIVFVDGRLNSLGVFYIIIVCHIIDINTKDCN